MGQLRRGAVLSGLFVRLGQHKSRKTFSGTKNTFWIIANKFYSAWREELLNCNITALIEGGFLMRKSWCIMKDSSLLSLLRMTSRGRSSEWQEEGSTEWEGLLSSWAPSPVILSVAKDLFLKVQEKDSSLLSLLRMTSRGRSSEWHIYVGVKYFWEFWKSFKRARWNHLYLNICHPRVRRYCMVRACNAIATPAARR